MDMPEPASAAPLTIRLFGPLTVRVNGCPLPRLRSRVCQRLLALLTLRHGCEVERTWLSGLLWPERPTSQALAAFRRDLTDVRRALGQDAVRLRSPSSYSLCLDLAGADVDVVAFDAAIARGDAPALEHAVGLYRGPLLEGWIEEWVFQERQAREQAYIEARERLAKMCFDQGETAKAERHLRLAVAVDPLRESSQRALMEALAAGGNFAAALTCYRDFREHLHRTANTEPDVETQTLFQQLRSEARRLGAKGSGSTGQQPAERVTLGTRGAIRGPVPTACGLPDPTGTLRAADPGGPDISAARPFARPPEAPFHNLPLPLTRFVGREEPMAEIVQMLALRRLVTLAGAGGCGKSRLALQVAGDLIARFVDGVWLVELAALTDPALVPQTVASILGIREDPGRSLTQTLAACLQHRHLLLLLDNCEHLRSAAASLAEALLGACSEIQILATSREPLGTSGEQLYRVPPLSLPPYVESRGRRVERTDKGTATTSPELSTLLTYEAIQLFVDRARLCQPDFAITAANAGAVVQVCGRLEGIPLAIELAAARVMVMPVERLNERLADMFRLLTGSSRAHTPRHRTLPALIGWSYDLLTEPEKLLLCRLSVFAGGWTLEGAEAVCSDSGFRAGERGEGPGPRSGWPPTSKDGNDWTSLSGPIQYPICKIQNLEVLDLLTSLVEKSLVHYQERDGEERYWLLETVRQYSGDRLRESGEADAVRSRHLAYFMRLAEAAEPQVIGAQRSSCLSRLEKQLDNIRAALAYSLECGSGRAVDAGGGDGVPEPVQAGLRLAGAIGEFWVVRGYWTEERHLLDQLLATSGMPKRTAIRAKALRSAGALAIEQRDAASTQSLYEESLSICQELGDTAGVATSLWGLGYAAWLRGDQEAACRFHEESLVIRRELGDRLGMASSLQNLAFLAWNGSEAGKERARRLFEESLDIWRELGFRWGRCWSLIGLSGLAAERGDLKIARALAEEAAASAREAEHKQVTAAALGNLGCIARSQGDYDAAWACHQQCLEIRRDLGYQELVAVTLGELGAIAQLQGHCGAARDHYLQSLRIYHETGSNREIPEVLQRLAQIASMEGDGERAVLLFGAAEALREAASDPPSQSDLPKWDGVQTCREVLGEADFTAAWTRGRALSLEQAVCLASAK